jgi:hypothetical protein
VIEASAPVPKSYIAHQAFEIPSVAPKGGSSSFVIPRRTVMRSTPTTMR